MHATEPLNTHNYLKLTLKHSLKYLYWNRNKLKKKRTAWAKNNGKMILHLVFLLNYL